MSEVDPEHQYEVQWEGNEGGRRTAVVEGDKANTDINPPQLAISYSDRKDAHFKIVDIPFLVREME